MTLAVSATLSPLDADDESAEEALQDGTGFKETTRRVKKTESFFGTDPDRYSDLYEVGCLYRNRDGIKR